MTDTLVLEDEEIVSEFDPGDPGQGEMGTVIGLDPCKCSLAHDTPTGECDQSLPEGHAPNRQKCDGCNRDSGWIHKKRGAKKDSPPVNINVNLPKPQQKLDTTQQKVVEAATAWLTMLAQGLLVAGDPVCAQAIEQATPQIALQLAILSKFHPIIVKILAPVEATGEALAWLSLSMALAPVILVVLVHHHVLSEEQAKRFGVLTMMGAVVGATPTAEPEAA